MPRNVSDVYSKPSGTTAVTGTTIESATFNQLMDDIAADLNTPRPIVAGGTGAATASAALTALGGLAAANDLSDLASAATARTNLGVVPQTSIMDATAGRLMLVGAFGWGETGTATVLADVDNLGAPSGQYQYTAATVGTRPTAELGGVLHIRQTATSAVQILVTATGIVYYRGAASSVWAPWAVALTNVDKADQATAEAGTSTLKIMTPLRTFQAIAAERLTNRYTAVITGWTTGTRTARAHGFGAVPFDVTASLRCKLANNGWSVGDEITLHGDRVDASGVWTASNATNAYVVIRPFVYAPTFDASSWFTVLNTDWDIVLRARK
jgi:hypothetical protein